jgi:hypothetical protein
MAKPASIKVAPSYTTVTNTTDETTMATITVPAYNVKTDYRIEAHCQVEIPSSDSTDTFALKLKLGSTALGTVTAFDATNDDVCWVKLEGYIDSSAELLHFLALDGRTGQAADVEETVDVAFDTDTDKVFTVTGTWSVAAAANQAVCKFFIIKLEPVD